jgi:hypothetical protein
MIVATEFRGSLRAAREASRSRFFAIRLKAAAVGSQDL